MLRRLIILRHARSPLKSGASTDHERPLNPRGCRSAPEVARRIIELGWAPQWIVSSDSTRTRETCEHMLPVLPEPARVEFLNSLYLAGREELWEVLAGVPSSIECVLALGHNPGWEAVVRWCSGQQVVLGAANAALLEGHGENWKASVEKPGGWTLKGIVRVQEL